MNHLSEALRIYGPLRYVEDAGDYSVYEDRDGDEIYLQHGTGRELVSLDDLDIRDEWNRWLDAGGNRYTFMEALRERVIDDTDLDYLLFCGDCNRPEWEDDLRYTSGGSVCDSCIEAYWFCGGCDEYYRETTTVSDDEERCASCLARNWTWCSDCDEYFLSEDNHNAENHQGSGCCESPAPSFAVRNDGEVPLANDTRATVTLPAGVISAEGIGQISTHLSTYAYQTFYTALLEIGKDADGETYQKWCQLSYRLEELGDTWQAKQGNYTKRLSRFAYKEFGIKLPPEVMSEVGNIGRAHSTAIDFAIEVTRDLNLPPEDFAHEESCWWQSYYHGRCALKTNGGFGIRTFSEGVTHNGATYYDVEGRAWVLPLRFKDGQAYPTFNAMTPDAFVVFNGYGDLEGYAPARILSHMAGMTYRKIEFACSPMYVNNDSGYLVAPEEIAEQYTDGHLHLTVGQHSDLFKTEQDALTTEKVLTNA